jgi:threonylcarbamoyladenosine tRNA methylthiotransferase MtaB
VKEFVLTGIHISSYGVDFEDGSNLGKLIQLIAAIPEVKRIRLGSLEPRIITEEFLQIISESGKVCPHFHLSLQSACNDTLKRMNRKYTIEEFEQRCDLLRKYFDRPALTTDVIVGFPGETEEEFAVTLEHLKKIDFYEIHVFKYSVRSGTVAEAMPDQVSEEVKNNRSEVLLKLTAEQKAAYEAAMAGFEDEVLVEEEVEEADKTLKTCHALTEGNESPDLRCYVGHTKRYIKVKILSEEALVNQIIPVTLD